MRDMQLCGFRRLGPPLTERAYKIYVYKGGGVSLRQLVAKLKLQLFDSALLLAS